MKSLFVLLAIFLALGNLAMAHQEDTPKKQSGKFKFATKRADDRIEVQADKEKAVFIIRSPIGISHAVIERLADKWPEAVVLRLHLKGLENFQVSNSKVTVQAAVSVQEGQPRVRLWKDGKENEALDKQSPLWMNIRIVGDDGKAVRELPLKKGYFELALPKAFLDGNPQSITLKWIDFYR